MLFVLVLPFVMMVAVVVVAMVLVRHALVIAEVRSVMAKLLAVFVNVAPLGRGGTGISPFDVLAQLMVIAPHVGFFVMNLRAVVAIRTNFTFGRCVAVRTATRRAVEQ